ncbi:MAG: Fibronectin type III domain protein [Microgenomates bacterium OLB23]|nr:MAG: Fibronectin type III domain protein [Microgenomates bacterium OLB23]
MLRFLFITFTFAFIFKLNANVIKAADNLVGYWKFDQGSGTTPTDSSGANVSGSFTSTQPTWSTDVPSTQFSNPYSLDFTSTGDAVTISWPSSLNFNETAPRSFSFWYKPTGNGETASGNYDRIISWSDDKFEIAGTYGDVSVHRLAFYDGDWRDTGFDMSVGTWYNITFTYDGTNVKLYVNNSQKFSGTSNGRALSGTMYIGTRYTGDEGINGRIDDVRVYDRALTLSEIQNISEGGSGPGVPTSTPTPTPTSTPTPTPTITPTPTVVSRNSVTNQGSTAVASNTTSTPTCSDSKPHGVPQLFQIEVSSNLATLFFTPVSNADRYHISYGSNDSTNQHGVEVRSHMEQGVVSYVIKDLKPQATYSFKVRGGNGCMPGDWGNTLKVVTLKNFIKQKNIL